MVPGPYRVAGCVSPVQRALVRAPGQAVGGGGGQVGRADHAAHPGCTGAGRVTGIDTKQGRIAPAPGLVDGAHPEAPQRIALAVVGAHVGGVIVQRGQVLQRPAPGLRPEHAMAQRHHQAAAGRRGDAAGLAGHVPGFQRAHVNVGAQNLFA